MGTASVVAKQAPSTALLKFLRAQNANVAFFTPNSAARQSSSTTVFTTPLASPCRQHQQRMQLPSSRPRSMMTVSSPLLPMPASIFPLESLWSTKPRANTTLSGHGPDALATHGSRQTVSGVADDTLLTNMTNTPRRSVWTSSDAKSYRRFWGFGQSRKEQSPNTSALPQLASFLDENASLGRIGRAGNDLKLRCTEFDANGNVTLVNGEFKKTELIAKYGLLPRDLRKIDSSLLPHILVRKSAILINLLHLRVLIKHNRVLVFDAYGSTDSYTQSLFMYDLEGRLRTPSASGTTQLPYEFRALEAVLISVTSGLESEFEGVRGPVVHVLRELEEDIDREKLRHLLIYSKKLGSFEQKARLVRDAIEDILEADDDLADMYLSARAAKNAPEAEDDHTEIEMLLESYHKVCDEIVQVSGNLVSNIRNTEEVVRAILDANRNQLMLLDLKFSIGTLGLGGGTFVAALYGMNLKNFIEESDFGFWGVSAWCSIFSVFVLVWGMRKLKRTERLSMWGSGGGRTGYSSVNGPAAIAGPVPRKAPQAVLDRTPEHSLHQHALRERIRAVTEARQARDTLLKFGHSNASAESWAAANEAQAEIFADGHASVDSGTVAAKKNTHAMKKTNHQKKN